MLACSVRMCVHVAVRVGQSILLYINSVVDG